MSRLALVIALLSGCLPTSDERGECSRGAYECNGSVPRNCASRFLNNGGYVGGSDVENSWENVTCEKSQTCALDDDRKKALCALSPLPNPACADGKRCEGHFLVKCDGRFAVSREDCGECAQLELVGAEPKAPWASLGVGETVKLRLVRRSRCDDSTSEPRELRFESLEPRIATVSGDGVVTGVAAGGARISVTSGGLGTTGVVVVE